MPEVPIVRFDDRETLEASVSEDYGPWGARATVGQDVIDAFADLSDDHQWIHVDTERAKLSSPFGTTIAHGFLLLALLPRVRSAAIAITGQSSVLNYGSNKLRFLAPVPSGSEIHARSRVAAVEFRPNGTLVTTAVEVAVVDAPRAALLYEMQVLYR